MHLRTQVTLKRLQYQHSTVHTNEHDHIHSSKLTSQSPSCITSRNTTHCHDARHNLAHDHVPQYNAIPIPQPTLTDTAGIASKRATWNVLRQSIHTSPLAFPSHTTRLAHPHPYQQQLSVEFGTPRILQVTSHQSINNTASENGTRPHVRTHTPTHIGFTRHPNNRSPRLTW